MCPNSNYIKLVESGVNSRVYLDNWVD